MGRQLTTLVAVLALLSWTTVTTAQPTAPSTAGAAPVTVSVLGLEGADLPDDLTAKVTTALRRSVGALPGGRSGPGKDLFELKMVFGCDGEAPDCMAGAGRSLGADWLLYGGLTPTANGSDVVVSLRALDVGGARLAERIEETVPRASLQPQALDAQAARWVARLLPALASRQGPPAPVELSAPVAAPAETTAVAPEIPARPATSPRGPGRALRLTGAVAFVVGAAAALTGLGLYVHAQDLSNDNLASVAAVYADAPAAPGSAEAAWFSAPTCSAPGSIGAASWRFAYTSDCRHQSLIERTAIGLAAGGGALGVVGLVLYAVGRSQSSREASAGASSGRAPRSVVTPVLGVDRTGLEAAFRF